MVTTPQVNVEFIDAGLASEVRNVNNPQREPTLHLITFLIDETNTFFCVGPMRLVTALLMSQTKHQNEDQSMSVSIIKLAFNYDWVYSIVKHEERGVTWYVYSVTVGHETQKNQEVEECYKYTHNNLADAMFEFESREEGTYVNVQACREWLHKQMPDTPPEYKWFGAEDDNELEQMIMEQRDNEGTTLNALKVMLFG